MNIISHRGYWLHAEEKNTVSAFQRSFEKQFGTETDLRDVDCQLVISHDMATKDALPFSSVLKLLNYRPLPLALNIKADGLADTLCHLTSQWSELDYFVFDMSIPDMRQYLDRGMPVYGRMSEIERSIPWIEECKGIWLDAFQSIWYTEGEIEYLLTLKKKLCVVSRELHHANHILQWELLKKFSYHPDLILCTDIPEKAREYFGGVND